MRKSFYPKMAWSGISHNRKLYIPYFFTCIAMVMMFYIIDALSVSSVLVRIRGRRNNAGHAKFGEMDHRSIYIDFPFLYKFLFK